MDHGPCAPRQRPPLLYFFAIGAALKPALWQPSDTKIPEHKHMKPYPLVTHSATIVLCVFQLVVLLSQQGCWRPTKLKKLERECAAEKIRSCFMLAKVYGDGTEVEADVSKARDIIHKGTMVGHRRCYEQAHALSCHVVGAQYYRGSPYGLKPDHKKALDYFRMGCITGDKRSCVTYKQIKEQDGPADR
jgi:hypothetical protein